MRCYALKNLENNVVRSLYPTDTSITSSRSSAGAKINESANAAEAEQRQQLHTEPEFNWEKKNFLLGLLPILSPSRFI